MCSCVLHSGMSRIIFKCSFSILSLNSGRTFYYYSRNNYMMQSVFTFILYRVILDTSTAIICLDNFGALLLLTSFVWSIASVYYYRWHVMRCVGRRQKTKIGRSITAKRILLVVYSYTCIKSRSGKERRMWHISGMLLLKIDLLKCSVYI